MEFLVPRFDATGVDVEQEQGLPLYRVAGRISYPTGEDRFEGVVDARVARVLSVSRNGELFWKWGGIEVSAHRGAVKFAPENTLAAIDRAIELGADIIEMDIRETKDGHLVICHDSTLERTTNGSGQISAKTLAELKELDAGSWFGQEFAGEKIPTLRDALHLLKGRAKPDIDFKAGSPAKLIELLHEMGMGEGVTLYCNDLGHRREILDLDNRILPRPNLPYGKWSLPALIEEWDPPLINVEWREFSEGLIRDIHLSGKKAFVNVHSSHDTEFKTIAAIGGGADIIQADSLDILVPLLRERGLHE
jgi:glycerophosphoryl diester phosphodiesterase